MITAVQLPVSLQEQLRGEALRAYPRECCGLLEGTADASTVHVVALHPMPNIAKEPDRFEIDPAAHIAVLRTLRGSGHDIVGCYHSHPNGRAEPSERDRAVEEGFLWLITAVEHELRATTTVAFVVAAQRFSAVPFVHDVPGTAGVSPRPEPTRLIVQPRRSYNGGVREAAPIV